MLGQTRHDESTEGAQCLSSALPVHLQLMGWMAGRRGTTGKTHLQRTHHRKLLALQNANEEELTHNLRCLVILRPALTVPREQRFCDMSSEGLDPSIPRAEDAFEDAFKVITIGDPDVGKTCLILRYTTDTYHPNLINTVGQQTPVGLWEVEYVQCGGEAGKIMYISMRGGAARTGAWHFNTVGPFCTVVDTPLTRLAVLYIERCT